LVLKQQLLFVSHINFYIHSRVRGLVAAAAVALATSCASTAPKHPAPVVARIPEPAQVTKVYPVEQPSKFVGEELRGSVLPDTPDPRVLLGTSLDGAPVYLTDYRGKVVVASYWASWCPPCWTELPQLEDIRTQYNGRDVEIIAINFGEIRSAIDGFLQQQQRPLRFTIASDRSGQASAAQGVKAVPTTLVFDAEGNVSMRYGGMFGFNAQRLRNDIDRLLGNRG
jgi:thiol-disulfide isomerase/thioredoxin